MTRVKLQNCSVKPQSIAPDKVFFVVVLCVCVCLMIIDADKKGYQENIF